jgi:RNA polymerase sigma-70 factor (ECF subfamily)
MKSGAASHAREQIRDSALTDNEVVRRVLQGETELFEILMRRYNQRLYRIARGFVREASEAEDIAQEACVSAFQSLPGFRHEASFSTWLTRIAVHEALARVRRRRRFVPFELETQKRKAERQPGPERSAESRELGALLSEAVDSLPRRLRSVFVLRDVEGLSSEEAATALGISTVNVRVRLHRAKALLRNRLDAQLGQEVRRLFLFAGRRCDRLVEAVFRRVSGGASSGLA